METSCTLLLFLARSAEAAPPPGKGRLPEWGGFFAVPASAPEAIRLLDAELDKEGLARVQTGDPLTFSSGADWGRFEDVKAQMKSQGFGLRLTPLPPPV